jgi:hypothetical protein
LPYITGSAAVPVAASPAKATTFVIINQDGPGEGFNDPTRVGRCLERQGLLERDAENGYLTTDAVN